MKFILWNIMLLVFLVTGANAQSLRMDQRVSFDFSNVRLEDALVDISQEYQVRFSYSAYYIPLDKSVTAHVKNKRLDNALGDLFENTGIVYKPIGDQVVLKMAEAERISQNTKSQNNDRAKITQTNDAKVNRETTAHSANKKASSTEESENTSKGYFQIPMNMEDIFEQERSRQGELARARIPQALQPMNPRPMPIFIDSQRKLKFDWKSHFEKLIADIKSSSQQIRENVGQISLAPYVGTNFKKSNETINTVSVNVLWGINGGVDGVEIGGIANSIKYDMYGVQLAGLANTVGGDVQGIQASGFLNYNNGTTNGAQFTLGLNITNDVNAVQIAGLANVVHGNATGVQASAGVNIVENNAGFQIAGLANKANGTVAFGQASVFNKAGYVKGFQLGLINVCDSIAGVPIGLINIVKKGKNKFNKIELSGGDLLTGNFALKLGAKKFYNIIHVGIKKSKEPNKDDSWALGYGFGRAFDLGNRSLINLELLSLHVNENSVWTNQLNLLNQLKLYYDFRFAGRFSVFAGPTANVFVSHLYDNDSNTFGTSLLTEQNLLFDNQNQNNFTNNTNVKIWIGFNAGIRF